MARRVSIPDAGDAVTVEGRSSPKLREARKSDISAEQIETFFITLGDTCNVVRSARAAGFSANWAYRRRKYDAAFRNGWVAAVREGYAKLEVVLLERAMKGPIWRRARCRRNCSTMRRCSESTRCCARRSKGRPR